MMNQPISLEEFSRGTEGSNPSGVAPIDLRVIVRPDPVEEKKGLVFLPPSAVDQEKYAQTKGTLIAIGENAWEEAEERALRYGRQFTMPQPGDRVLIGKYSGIDFKGADGLDYKMMNDSDVTGRLGE